LAAAADVLADLGYHGFAIETVAARAGVAKTTIYRRWAGRDELVLDAINAIKGPPPELPEGSVRDQMLFLVERTRRSWTNSQHGRMMRRLAADGSAQPELYRMFRDRVVAPRQVALRAVLRRGIDEGLIRPDVDVAGVIDMLIAPVIMAVMTHRERLTSTQVAFVVDTVLRGLAP